MNLRFIREDTFALVTTVLLESKKCAYIEWHGTDGTEITDMK